MSSRFLEVEVDVAEVVKALEKMQRRSLNLRPFMGAVGMIMIKAVHENFEHEGRPKWKRWSALTQEAYSGHAVDKAKGTKAHQKAKAKGKASIEQKYIDKHMTGTKILQNQGELKKSVVIGNLTRDSVEVGSNLIYSRIHQLGGVIKPVKAKILVVPMGGGRMVKLKEVKMPARPYLKLQESDYATIVRVAKDYLERGEIG